MAKKEKKRKEKKAKKTSFLKEVINEMKKVNFPSIKEVAKYTFATIIMVAFLIIFFLGLTFLLSQIKGAF